MDKILTVFKWELHKLFSSWKKAVALFLLPAILLMASLNVFPLLINYMSTGSFNQKPILVVDAPKSFIDYVENTVDARVYEYKFISAREYDSLMRNRTQFCKDLRKGMLVCGFTTGDRKIDFDEEISNYYYNISAGNSEAISTAEIHVCYDYDSVTAEARAQQFEEGVLKGYQSSLIDRLGGDYSVIGGKLFDTNTFNPVTDFLEYRSTANYAASRVVPGVLMIMMYYCVYSLVSDMFASERDRGFMAKLLLTPVSKKKIYSGKILAIVSIVSASACITMLLLFFSSWINRSNNAMSLLPFGMMLTPSELLIILFSIPITALLMTAICISITFELKRMQDITVNLQLPLIYFLADFFLQMFRGTRPTTIEYFIPLHNTLQLVSETFMAQNKAWHVILIYLMNLGLAYIILRYTFRKEETK